MVFKKHSQKDYPEKTGIVGQLTGTILALWLALILVPFHKGEQTLSPEILWFQLKDFQLQYPQFYLATATIICLSPLFQKTLTVLVRFLIGGKKDEVKSHIIGESIIACTLVIILSSHFHIYSKSFTSKPIVYDVVDKYYLLGSEEQCYRKIWRPLAISYIQAVEKGNYSEAQYISTWLLYIFENRFKKLRRTHDISQEVHLKVSSILRKQIPSTPDDNWLTGADKIWKIYLFLNPVEENAPSDKVQIEKG